RHRASPVAGRWRAPPPGHRGGRQARRPGRPARGGPPGRRSVLAEGLPDVLHGVGRLVLRGLDRVGGVGAEAVAAALPLQVLVAGGAAQALLGLPLRPVELVLQPSHGLSPFVLFVPFGLRSVPVPHRGAGPVQRVVRRTASEATSTSTRSTVSPAYSRSRCATRSRTARPASSTPPG